MNKGLEYVLSLNDQISAPLAKVRGGMDALSSGVKSVLAISAAFTAVTGAVTAFIDANVTALDEIYQLSNVTGASANAIFSLGQMAEVNGSSVEAAQRSIEGLSKVIGEAASGTGKGAKAFKLYGLSALDGAGNIKDTMRVLDDIRVRMQGLSEQEQIAMLAKMGIDGSMIQVLRLSNDELAALHEKTEAFSLGAATDKNAQAAAEFKDSMTELMQIIKGAGQYLAVTLAPVITGVIQQFSAWYIANNQLIRQGLSRLVTGLESFFSKAFRALESIHQFISSTIGWENAMYALIGVFLVAQRSPILSLWDMLSSGIKGASGAIMGVSGLFTKFFSLIPALGAKSILTIKAIPGALMAIKPLILGSFLPFTAGILVITAVSYAIYKLRHHFAAFFGGVLSGFKAWSLSFEPIKSAFGRLGELFSRLFNLNEQNTAGVQRWADVGQWVGQALGATFQLVINSISAVINIFAVLLETAIDVVTGICEGWDFFTQLISDGSWGEAVFLVFDGVLNIGKKAWLGIKTAAIEAINGLIEIINKFGANITPIEIPVTVEQPKIPQAPVTPLAGQMVTMPQPALNAVTQSALMVAQQSLQPRKDAEGKMLQIPNANPRTADLERYNRAGNPPINQTNNNQRTINMTINTQSDKPRDIAREIRAAEQRELGIN